MSTAETTREALFQLPYTDPRPVPDGLAAVWDEAAGNNPWIRRAWDPAFKGSGVRICASRDELRRWLELGNWSNGSAFALIDEATGESLCFMHQGEATDEWLAVKTRPSTFKGRPAHLYVAFESVSWFRILARRPEKFGPMLDDLLAATLDECRSLEYRGAAARKNS